MNQDYQKFRQLFNSYRLKAQFETLTQFGEALARQGFLYEDSMFSRWKNGDRMPKHRPVVLAILRVFIKHKAITKPEEALEFLHATSQRAPNDQELRELFSPSSSFTYNRDPSPMLTEEEALFLAGKILGTPFTMLYKEKIKTVFNLSQRNPHTYLKVLQQIESNPLDFENIFYNLHNKEMTIHDHSPKPHPTSCGILFLKKPTHVRFSDTFVMI
jgi:hypothetical protein